MMHDYVKKVLLSSGIAFSTVGFSAEQPQTDAKKVPHVIIVMGSVRDQSTSASIAQALVKLADKDRLDLEIIDLKKYPMPLVDLESAVSQDQTIRAWSAKVTQADAVILLVPNYNEGYSGVLKNALDVLSSEWHNKLVGVIGYSGGGGGGKGPVDFMQPVLKSLHMKPLQDSFVYIPFADSAVNEAQQFKKQETQESVVKLLQNIVKELA